MIKKAMISLIVVTLMCVLLNVNIFQRREQFESLTNRLSNPELNCQNQS
jgi:hypothetical protein